MAPRICGACGADLSQRPHYPWCPNATRWLPWDAWVTAYEGTLRVDNGLGFTEARAWVPPARTTFDDETAGHAPLRGVRR